MSSKSHSVPLHSCTRPALALVRSFGLQACLMSSSGPPASWQCSGCEPRTLSFNLVLCSFTAFHCLSLPFHCLIRRQRDRRAPGCGGPLVRPGNRPPSQGRPAGNRGSTIDSAPSSLQLCIYCGCSVNWLRLYFALLQACLAPDETVILLHSTLCL